MCIKEHTGTKPERQGTTQDKTSKSHFTIVYKSSNQKQNKTKQNHTKMKAKKTLIYSQWEGNTD